MGTAFIMASLIIIEVIGGLAFLLWFAGLIL